MKPRILSLVPLSLVPCAAALLGACQSTASHWDAEHAAESASFHMLGANGQTSETIVQTSTQGSHDITLTMRRHFFNDNPANPLQEHHDNTFGRYVPIWDMPVNAVLDTGDIVVDAVGYTGQGAVGAILMPWQLVAGTSEVKGYEQPPPPEDFKVRNK